MSDATERWTPRFLLAFWLPLALSWTMMAVAQPVVSIGISRLPNPEVHLAAYGVTLDLAVLIESPIIMLFSASVALARDQVSYRLLRRFTLLLCGTLMGLFALVAFTSLFDVVVVRLLAVPPPIAAQVRPALQVLLPWVPAIAWRRLHQGPLLVAGTPRLITYGTLCRLLALGTVVFVGTRWALLPGVLVGAVALAVSVVVEALLITIWARPVTRRLPEGNEEELTTRKISKFYVPLASTDLMRVLSRPVTTAGIARAAFPSVSLSAWPVANGLSQLLSSGVMAFQEMVVALSGSQVSYRRISQFVILIGLGCTGLVALVAFTPLADGYLTDVVRLPADLIPPTESGLRVLVLLPVLLAVRNLFRGTLIRTRHTQHVQHAMAVNLATLVVVLTVGAWQRLPGVLLAASATLVAQAVEVLVLLAFLQTVARPAVVTEAGR